MRIAIAINKNHPNYSTFLAFLSQATVSIKDMSVDIVSFSDIAEIHSLVNKKCKYTLIMNRYCYIDFNKLYSWLVSNQPNIAGLSTHNGIGYPYLLIIKTNLCQPISNLVDISKTKDYIENYFMNWIQRFISSQSKHTEITRNDTSKYKILSLDSVCYLAHCNYINGLFHKSIFICFSDLDKNFSQTLKMLASGIKEVFYKNQLYKLKIGKSFFVYKHWHFAIMPERTVLVWNGIKNDWVIANQKEHKILQQII